MTRRSQDELLALHELLPLAWSAATRAGAFLRDERPDDLEIDTKSTDTDVVSEMDRAAERMIVDDVLGARPDDGLLGEEGGERAGTSGVRWVVDPLDGTVNYLHRIPLWGVSIGVEVDGRTEVAVVDVPVLRETYVAVRGEGAWLVRDGVGERLQVSDCADLGRAVVATGFRYSVERRMAQAAVVAGLIGQIADIRRIGAAVVDFCWMARGRLDAYFEEGLSPWDSCAGFLIVEEAGAVVTGVREDGTDADFVVAGPAIHAALRAALADLVE